MTLTIEQNKVENSESIIDPPFSIESPIVDKFKLNTLN